ncbi:MAG: hypothetical protein RLY87_199 [Chloroflexota bacterium]
MSHTISCVQKTPALTVSALWCRYGTHVAVSDASLTVNAGEHVALIGGNGSGKTTFLRAVLGFHPRTSGTLAIQGRQVPMRGYHDWVFRSIAWMPQRQATGAFPLLVHELLASSTNPVAAQDAAAALAVDTLAERNLSTLSGGQLQRVFLARALGCLAGGAALLIADEPTAALDFAGQQIMAQLLTESAHTMLVVTHDRALIERCDRIYEMAGGQMREVSR